MRQAGTRQGAVGCDSGKIKEWCRVEDVACLRKPADEPRGAFRPFSWPLFSLAESPFRANVVSFHVARTRPNTVLLKRPVRSSARIKQRIVKAVNPSMANRKQRSHHRMT